MEASVSWLWQRTLEKWLVIELCVVSLQSNLVEPERLLKHPKLVLIYYADQPLYTILQPYLSPFLRTIIDLYSGMLIALT
jgi:hypothetical protein